MRRPVLCFCIVVTKTIDAADLGIKEKRAYVAN